MEYKRVQFSEVTEEFLLDDENEDRKSTWISDAAWFKQRIYNLERILTPLIEKKQKSKKEFEEKIKSFEAKLKLKFFLQNCNSQ